VSQKSISRKLNAYLIKIFIEKSTVHKIRIIGIFIFSFSLIFFSNFSLLSIKLGSILLSAGLFLIFLIKDENKITYHRTIKLIMLYLIWMWVVLFITTNNNYEIFFLLILVGMLVINEITDEYTPVNFKIRMNIFIFAFFIIFIVILIQKIITA
jgi:hypothetical protein